MGELREEKGYLVKFMKSFWCHLQAKSTVVSGDSLLSSVAESAEQIYVPVLGK